MLGLRLLELIGIGCDKHWLVGCYGFAGTHIQCPIFDGLMQRLGTGRFNTRRQYRRFALGHHIALINCEGWYD